MIEIETLWKYDLRRGNTDHPGNGACLYDAAKWISYAELGDDPPCACPVIRAYAITLNDMFSDDQRQRLKPFILRVIDNFDPASEPARVEYLIRCVVGKILPIALEAGEFTQQAALLRRAAHDETLDELRRLAEETVAAIAECGMTSHRVAIANAAATAAQVAAGGVPLLEGAIAWAAIAAAKAGDAEFQRVHDAAIDALDGVLRIGRQARPFDEERVRRAITVFEVARGDL
jgi:hypothetical protein